MGVDGKQGQMTVATWIMMMVAVVAITAQWTAMLAKLQQLKAVVGG